MLASRLHLWTCNESALKLIQVVGRIQLLWGCGTDIPISLLVVVLAFCIAELVPSSVFKYSNGILNPHVSSLCCLPFHLIFLLLSCSFFLTASSAAGHSFYYTWIILDNHCLKSDWLITSIPSAKSLREIPRLVLVWITRTFWQREEFLEFLLTVCLTCKFINFHACYSKT